MQFVDQTGYSIELKATPKRIVSLVPSQTELLFDLGLETQMVGRTKFCILPKGKVEDIQRIGGTKNVQIDSIRALDPDLIIANKEENTKETIEALRLEFPVWTSDVFDIDSSLNMIAQVGEMTDTLTQAQDFNLQIRKRLNSSKKFEGQRVIYLIWKDPWMTVGGDTFISAVLKESGLQNVFENEKRYPITSLEEIAQLSPDLLLLSSEPYPFKGEDRDDLGTKLLGTHVSNVAGEIFSWYGSRLLHLPVDWPSILGD